MSAKRKLREEEVIDSKEEELQLKSQTYEDLKAPVKAVEFSCRVYFLMLLSELDVGMKNKLQLWY